MIHIQVIASDTSGQKIHLLPISGLHPRGNTRVTYQLPHGPPDMPHN